MLLAIGSATHQQVASATSIPRSQNIALVPNAGGRFNNGGTLPTSGFPNYAPTFTNVSQDSIRNDAVDPLTTGGFDTVVLNGICDIASYLADPQFKSRVEGFVSNGGKLIIWDSECQNTDYSGFALPFTTNNPGAQGAQGTLTDLEENPLSSTDSTSPSFVNDALIAGLTDAVGDSNVFTTFDQNWFVDLQATNINHVTGPVQAYGNIGRGLVIYSGLDKDYMPGPSFDPAATDGASHLNRIWLLQLLQPWDPDNLPGTVKAFGLALTPKTGSDPAGTSHTLTAHVTRSSVPLSSVIVHFEVTLGPCEGRSGDDITDSSGNVSFTYSCSSAGTDTVTATALIDNGSGGLVTVFDSATEEWISRGRYVVLGDSVPYGHGLADPKQNQPPSHLAYPELVQQGLSGIRPLSYRPDNCTLTGDQLAVSGAPAIPNVLVGGDGRCGVSVFPQEVIDAQMQSNAPALVTIQVGADDIRFTECLSGLLFSKVFGGENCATGKDPNFKLSSKVQRALTSLQTGLTATINTIHREAPNAQILLVNYYQIVPGPDTQLVNETSSALCAGFEAQSVRKGRDWRVAISEKANFVQGQLNSTIRGAANSFSDVKLVDISSLFGGVEMCAPHSLLFDGFSKFGTSTAGHPTALGQRIIADAILRVCGTLPKKCIGR
jgi:hypothetical protein